MTLRTLLTQILPGFSCCRERGSPSALRMGCSPALQFSANAAARSWPRHCVRRHCRLCRHKSSPDHPSEFGVRGADGRSYSSLGAGSAPALRFIARAVAARRVNVLVDTADSADTNPARFFWSSCLARERRRTKVIPHAFGERAVLKLMYAALIRTAERWRGIRITEFEQRQLKAIREEIDKDFAVRNAPAATAPQSYLSSNQRT